MPYMMNQEEVRISKLNYSPDEVEIHGPCANGINHSVVVNKMSLKSWLDRDMLVQDAFPHLTPNEREFLITGTCCAPFWDE